MTTFNGGTTNGLSLFTQTWGSGTGCIQVTSQPCQVSVVALGSIAVTPAFLKMYDTAACATSGIGNGSANFQLICPGNTAGAGADLSISFGPTPMGLQFVNGLAVQVTNNIALADASGAGQVAVSIGYR